MRIGQWTHFGMGGASKVIEVLSHGLKELGLEVIIFYNDASIPKPHELSRFSHYSNFNVVKIQDFGILNNFKLDVLNTHRGGNDKWAFSNFDQLTYNFKIVETNFHGVFNSKKDLTVFPSNTMLRGKSVHSPYKVIYNPTFPSTTDSDLRSEFALLNGKFVYGRIGRSDLDIFSRINLIAYKKIEDESTAFLYVSPNKAAIKLAQDLGIRNIVFLPPTVDEKMISKIYNTMDVLCHSNPIGETFGNTIAEAMIHGRPVISHLGSENWPQAQVELLGDLGFLCVAKDDVEAYANLMIKMKSDASFYANCVQYLKNRSNDFDYINISKQYVEAYRSVM